MTTLEVNLRTDEFGKGAARKLRAKGMLPAVIYGPGNEPMSLSIDPEKLQLIFKETGNRNTVVQLTIDGQTVPALVRDVQRHPVTRDLVHVDFYRVDVERKVDVMVPVKAVGRAAGTALGGRLRVIRRVVHARCKPNDIPAAFEVDVTALEINDMVKATEIPLPGGVELIIDDDFVVIAMYGKLREIVEEVDEDEEGEGEEGAEGAEESEGAES